MKPPRGVLKARQEGKVLRLKKGLYGLKQARRGWHQQMSKVFLDKMNFKRLSIDHSVFYKHTSDKHMVVTVVTNDMALTSKRKEDVTHFKTEIQKYWVITDHSPIN